MIKPTIGRVVWFRDSTLKGAISKDEPEPQPCAAIIAFVHSDTLVNLTVFDWNGCPNARTSVPLFQGDGERPDGSFCEWMPYQQGQAAKTEALEKKLEEAKGQ